MSERTKSKVAIVGFAPSWSKVISYFDDDDCEIWGLNELYNFFRQVPNSRADRWFEIHNPNSPSKNTPQHRAWLKKASIPIYMQKHYDEIPNSVEYPKDEVIKFFEERGHMGKQYFTNSISWMIALAIKEGFKEIAILGVDMATDSEYGSQKPSCEYFIGIAEGMGIKTYLPCESDLLKAGVLYGYESDNTMRLKIKGRIKELEERKKQALAERQKAMTIMQRCDQTIAELNGAVTDANYWLSNWS